MPNTAPILTLQLPMLTPWLPCSNKPFAKPTRTNWPCVRDESSAGYVEVGEAACELLEELLQSELDDMARRAKLGLDDAAIQIGLGFLRGLAECRTAVIDGTVLAYAGEDVTDGQAWSVWNALARAKVTLPEDACEALPDVWGRQ